MLMTTCQIDFLVQGLQNSIATCVNPMKNLWVHMQLSVKMYVL